MAVAGVAEGQHLVVVARPRTGEQPGTRRSKLGVVIQSIGKLDNLFRTHQLSSFSLISWGALGQECFDSFSGIWRCHQLV